VKEVKGAPKALTHLELLRFLRTVDRARKPRDIAIVEVLANTGVRVGELAALTPEDVEFSERSGWVTGRSSEGEKYRWVPLRAGAWKALAECVEIRAGGEDEQLLVGERGGGLTSSEIWRLVKKYGERAGLDISPVIYETPMALA
jgi:integrase